MRNKAGKIMISAGALLILSAMLLCLHNILESRRAGQRAERALTALKAEIPEKSPAASLGLSTGEDDIFGKYAPQDSTDDMPAISLDGELYCGYISLPALGLELPVMSSLTYPGLKTAPCRYSGSVSGGDLIIAAHNYSTHFGSLRSLSEGDMIFFTDCTGEKYSYRVIGTEEVGGSDSSSMLRGGQEEWQLTLFTCTLSGRDRVTVRAFRTDEIPA